MQYDNLDILDTGFEINGNFVPYTQVTAIGTKQYYPLLNLYLWLPATLFAWAIIRPVIQSFQRNLQQSLVSMGGTPPVEATGTPWITILLLLGTILGAFATFRCKRYVLWAIIANRRTFLYSSASEADVEDARDEFQTQLSK
jgi:hypothetical protein